MLKRPKLTDGFRGRVFKGNLKVRVAGVMISLWTSSQLVDGDVWGISIIRLLVPTSLGSMCLWPPSSTGEKVWVSTRQLKGVQQVVVYILQEELWVLWLSVLVVNCRSLLLGAGEGLGDRIPSFLKTRSRGHRGTSYPGRPDRVLPGSTPPLFSDIPQSRGEQGQDKKGSTTLDREVNPKLDQEILF